MLETRETYLSSILISLLSEEDDRELISDEEWEKQIQNYSRFRLQCFPT